MRVNNQFLLNNSNDPFHTLSLTVKTEKEIVDLIKETIDKIVDLVDLAFSDKNTLEEMVLLAQDSKIAEINQELTQIEADIGSRMFNSIKNAVKQAYQKGNTSAQTQINRIYPNKQPSPYNRLSPDDLRLIQTYQDTNFSLIRTLNQQQITQSRLIFVNGMNQGYSQKHIIQDIRNLTGNSEYNARRIVRTEITRTANNAARKLYLQSGLEFWQWNTSIDERVCEYCAPLHGKVVKIGDSLNQFLDEELNATLKGRLVTQPPFHPFCRCTMSPAVKPVKSVKDKAISPPLEEVLRPKYKGFTPQQIAELNGIIKHIPNQIKKEVKILKGQFDIVKTKGEITDDPTVKAIIPQNILNKHRGANGLYVGGLNRLFVNNVAGSHEVMHEVGHSVYDEYVTKKTGLKQKWDTIHSVLANSGNLITPRSTNTTEHFADVFRFYLLAPDVIKFKYPELYDFMNKNIFLGNESDKIVTLEDGEFLMKDIIGNYRKYKYGVDNYVERIN